MLYMPIQAAAALMYTPGKESSNKLLRSACYVGEVDPYAGDANAEEGGR